MRLALEKPKAAKTVFADDFAGRGIENIDEHIFFRMTGQKTGENFDEVFLLGRVGSLEPFSYVQPMGSFAAVKPHPIAGTIGTLLVEPSFVLRYQSLDFFKIDVLRRGRNREQQCKQKER